MAILYGQRSQEILAATNLRNITFDETDVKILIGDFKQKTIL